MKYRTLGKTGYKVSEIGYGSWGIGGGWGTVSDEQARTALSSISDTGINFIDTADIYGNGRSEKFIGEYIQNAGRRIIVATKIGRKSDPHTRDAYTKSNMHAYIEQSRKNLNTSCIDILQLHTPPTEVYYMPQVFSFLDEMVKKKKIRFYGVSVEKVEEALKAIEYPNVSTIQIIFNMFRQRPMELLFREAKKRNIGIIVRVPLASGLLTGKFSIFSRFPKNDHRNFNRHGEVFDQGETFAGVDFYKGLSAVRKIKSLKGKDYTMAQFALKWILMQDAVSTVIVGGKTPLQIKENAASSDLPKLSEANMKAIKHIYDTYVKNDVHYRW